MATLLITIALLLTASTLLPMSKATHWIVRSQDFPRLQLVILLILWLLIATVALIVGSAVGAFWWVLVMACLAYQLWWITPYSSLYPVEAAAAGNIKNLPQFSLLTSNVLMDNRCSEKLIALVNEHKPDVLATLETDSWWQQRLDTLEAYPHRVACALDNKYGMHVYSQLPFKSEKIEYLVENDIPSMNLVVQLTDNTTIRLHIVHPRPPAPGENDRSTERDVELLILAST